MPETSDRYHHRNDVKIRELTTKYPRGIAVPVNIEYPC